MKKIVSLILALAMCLGLTPAVFAADVPTADAEETTLTLEQAAEIFDLPIEELEGLEILPMPNSNARIQYELNPAIYYEEVSITSFTSNLHKINGRRFQWTYTVGDLNPEGACVGMKIGTWRAGKGTYITDEYAILQKGYTLKSPMFSVAYGTEMYMKYNYTSVSFDGQPVMKSGKALVVILVLENAGAGI